MNDIIPQILSHLPIRSLIRFQTVSKQWKQLIYTIIHVGQDIKFSFICPHSRTNSCFSCYVNENNHCHANMHILSQPHIIKCIDAFDNNYNYIDKKGYDKIALTVVRRNVTIHFTIEDDLKFEGVSIYNQMRVLLRLLRAQNKK
jgi:hypothetical protein